jgi:hypothetical protein
MDDDSLVVTARTERVLVQAIAATLQKVFRRVEKVHELKAFVTRHATFSLKTPDAALPANARSFAPVVQLEEHFGIFGEGGLTLFGDDNEL